MDMNSATLRHHLNTDTDAELSRYLDELNRIADCEAPPSIRDRIWAREAAYVVANTLVNRKAVKIIAARKAIA